MADEPLVIQGINWRETFPFTNIFRGFKIAIHPSKLVLALAALFLLYIGGRALDGIWHVSNRPTLLDYGQIDRDYSYTWSDVAGVRMRMGRESMARTVGYSNEVPFMRFFNYEAMQVRDIATAVLNGQWQGEAGVWGGITRFAAYGPGLALTRHPFFFSIFTIWYLIIWAVFGGAIARIAAVHVARDEKISVRQALRFSISKFLSFVCAPLIPLLIVLVVGVVLALGGLLFYIPYFGPLVASIIFFLALAAGFVMTLLVIGTGAGFNLMYPTIAVEGSDSFDAISRSFSYIYSRPWRMLFYTLVAIAYGALTYLFVRFFIYLMLLLTNFFAGWWLGGETGRMWNTGIASIWPMPVFSSLPYDVDTTGMDWAQIAASRIIAVWVYIVISMLGAYVISYYFSVNTIIYYLMRREVDATELDDVYLEESDEEFADTTTVTSQTKVEAPDTVAPAAAADTNAAPAAAPAVEPPPATPPADTQQNPPA